jgi:hypothetical protein
MSFWRDCVYKWTRRERAPFPRRILIMWKGCSVVAHHRQSSAGEVGFANGRQPHKRFKQTVGLQTESGPSVWALSSRLTTPSHKNRTYLLGNHTTCPRTIEEQEVWPTGERERLSNDKLALFILCPHCQRHKVQEIVMDRTCSIHEKLTFRFALLFLFTTLLGSLSCIATGYELDDRCVGVRVPVK